MSLEMPCECLNWDNGSADSLKVQLSVVTIYLTLFFHGQICRSKRDKSEMELGQSLRAACPGNYIKGGHVALSSRENLEVMSRCHVILLLRANRGFQLHLLERQFVTTDSCLQNRAGQLGRISQKLGVTSQQEETIEVSGPSEENFEAHWTKCCKMLIS